MEKTVEIKGLPVFYRDDGEGDAVLVLHGWRSSSNSWRDVQRGLVESGFRVIVPDLPGFGETPQPPAPWNVEDYVAFVRAFIEKTHIELRCMVGHSFGGRIASFYAATHRNELPALVLIGAAGFFRHKRTRVRIFALVTKMGDYIMRLPILRVFRPLTRRTLYRLVRQRDYYLTDGVMRETFKRVIDESMRPYLPHITAPTLILWGERDRLTPISDAYIIRDEVRVADLHIFPNAGHAVNLEIPSQTVRQIALFLRR